MCPNQSKFWVYQYFSKHCDKENIQYKFTQLLFNNRLDRTLWPCVSTSQMEEKHRYQTVLKAHAYQETPSEKKCWQLTDNKEKEALVKVDSQCPEGR